MVTTPHTILLKGTGIGKEGVANAAITPGMLVERMTTGKIRKHSTAGGPAMPAFARENELIGKEIDVDYAANDRVYWTVMPPGSEIYALVAASAVAIAVGDFLESAGDGTLRLVTVGDTADLTMGTNITAATANGSLEDSAATNPSDTNFNNNMKEIATKINAMLPDSNQRAVAVALEAVDNSANASSTARIKVEVL